MISRDYTQEVGLKSGTVRVPLPFAIMALVAAGLWFSLVKLHASAPVRIKHEAPAAQTPARPAPATASAVRHR